MSYWFRVWGFGFRVSGFGQNSIQQTSQPFQPSNLSKSPAQRKAILCVLAARPRNFYKKPIFGNARSPRLPERRPAHAVQALPYFFRIFVAKFCWLWRKIKNCFAGKICTFILKPYEKLPQLTLLHI
jgi:hypothetical protein